MRLAEYLKRAGVITGPISQLTRHTHLGHLKSGLMGKKIIITGVKNKGAKKSYQAFGTVLHELFLLGKLTAVGKKLWKGLDSSDKRKISGMLKALNSNPAVKLLMTNVVCEKTQRITMSGVRLQFTPDAVQNKKIGIDLKSTVCANFASFIYAAFGYGYYRQGVTYSRAAKLSDFFIIGIQKNPPYKVMVVHISKHRDKIQYAEKELDFLLYYYKKYGNFVK